jgi:hypothetical protein
VSVFLALDGPASEDKGPDASYPGYSGANSYPWSSYCRTSTLGGRRSPWRALSRRRRLRAASAPRGRISLTLSLPISLSPSLSLYLPLSHSLPLSLSRVRDSLSLSCLRRPETNRSTFQQSGSCAGLTSPPSALTTKAAVFSWGPAFGALVLCIETKSWLPVLQIPISEQTAFEDLRDMFIVRAHNFNLVKRLVLVQIIKRSAFQTQNLTIKQTWFKICTSTSHFTRLKLWAPTINVLFRPDTNRHMSCSIRTQMCAYRCKGIQETGHQQAHVPNERARCRPAGSPWHQP